jgi:carbohydrate diacid regulator
MVNGTGPVPRNYAFMVSSLLENAVIRSDETLSRTDGYRDILAGEYTKLQIQRFVAKYNVPKTPCYAFAIAADSKNTGEILSFLTQFDSNSDNLALLMEESIVAYVHYLDEDEEEYFSATEFATSLCNSLFEEAGIRANVGFGNVVKSFDEFPQNFRQAVAAIRMGNVIDAKSSVHSYREYLMVKMLEDLPQNVLQGYLDVLLDDKALEILEDRQMMETAEEFLNNSLNVSETSRHLFMHRNTLMYRLDKIENAMGLNIKHFSDAVTFRIIMIVHKLLKN